MSTMRRRLYSIFFAVGRVTAVIAEFVVETRRRFAFAADAEAMRAFLLAMVAFASDAIDHNVNVADHLQRNAIVRYAVQSLAVVSGTGAFISATTGHRNTAIGFALLSGALGLASVAVQAEHEGDLVLGPMEEDEPLVVPELSGAARGMMVGRIGGR